MFRFFFALLLSTLSSAVIANAVEQEPAFSFSGTVEEGKIYTHALPNNLYFHLYPYPNGGWEMAVNNVEDKYYKNISEIDNQIRITPPMHGDNPTDVAFDHFNQTKMRDLPFDPYNRQVQFALTPDDTKIIIDAYECGGVIPLNTTNGKKCELGPLPTHRGFATVKITKFNTSPSSIEFTVDGSYKQAGYVF